MKGIKLIILIMLIVGFISPILLQITAPDQFQSWSQYADNWNDPFLEAGLLAIVLTFFSLSLIYSEKDRSMFSMTTPEIKIFKIKRRKHNIKLRQLDRFIAFMFCGVIMFDAGDGTISNVMHYIFTGSGALGIYLRVVRFYSSGLKEKVAVFSATVGAAAWSIGFITSLWTIFLGEVIFYICSLPFIFIEFYKDELK